MQRCIRVIGAKIYCGQSTGSVAGEGDPYLAAMRRCVETATLGGAGRCIFRIMVTGGYSGLPSSARCAAEGGGVNSGRVAACGWR